MRLIDADTLPKYTGYALSADEVAMAVENAPTIDAVPVIRCKDCKHSEAGEDSPITAMWCTRFGRLDIAVEEDGYCSFGERKGNDK